jgi:zinc transporter, ZIP family
MSAWQTALLGAIAGGTIFLGLPLGRVGRLSARTRAFLATLSAGILLFIFYDVISQAAGVVSSAVVGADHGGSWARAALDTTMLAIGFAVGALGLAWVERTVHRRRPLAPMAGGSVADAAAAGLDVAELAEQARKAALALGMLIAAAIGVHNFSEGLAIGVAARSGEIALAGTLIAGFALHNATEGFGIVGPLGDTRPSWGWIGLAGLVGGGPTFLGTVVGYRVSSAPLELAFLALAAGAILFVVGELWTTALRKASRNLVLAGLVCGFLAGFITDLVITVAGA